MIHRIDLVPRAQHPDPRGEDVLAMLHASGVFTVSRVDVSDIYFVEGLERPALGDLVERLLLDPVTHTARIDDRPTAASPVVEVSFLPGVTDSVGESLVNAAAVLNHQVTAAASATRYVLHGQLTDAQVRQLGEQYLCNQVVEQLVVEEPLEPPFVGGSPAAARNVEHVALRESDDSGLLAVSQARRLSLDLQEMKAIQAHYRTLGREPTDLELEMLAQTWSEHCVHKTFKARIDYVELDSHGQPIESTREVVDNLLKSYIAAATQAANRPWVASAFVDNAGIVELADGLDLAFKVETHNHPSAIEPFGGANTGVGGVVRDVLGVSARPIANTDVLCFGPQDMRRDQLPEGVLHPRRIADGVVEGIGDYGNKMGIPTVNGAVVYDPGYVANPLVFCGCLGILPHGSHPTQPRPGDLVVVIGGRTGRDGLRGATFSSMEMSTETAEVAGSSVQIGHPIHEKQVLEVVLQARDEQLYTAITDCGAGGLSSAVGEMAEELGATVQLEHVPLKYPGLTPWEIWLSEAQERMVLAVPNEHWERLQELCALHDVDLAKLGTFTGDGKLVVRYENDVVGELSTHFLHGGIPQRNMVAVWQHPGESALTLPPGLDLEDTLLKLLGAPDSHSREPIVRTYDHEVQGGTVVKPFVGPHSDGPGDAAVVAPLEIWRRRNANQEADIPGVALSVGINPHYGALDPWAMAWAAVDEAFRNVVAVGADPEYVAILDNFCWGNPNLPDRLGALVRCARGCRDAAIAYGAPFVSGKDSLNNEYTGADGEKHAIPGTILISALARVPDIRRTVTAALQSSGNLIYVLGTTRRELGGSAVARVLNLEGGTPPAPQEHARRLFGSLHQAIGGGLVESCHDCSEGGIALALAEMSLSARLGVAVNLDSIPVDSELTFAERMFSESLSRFVVEVAPEHGDAFEACFDGLPIARVGSVTTGADIRIASQDDTLTLSLVAALGAHRGPVI